MQSAKISNSGARERGQQSGDMESSRSSMNKHYMGRNNGVYQK